ncbi:DinB family protein [Alkalicoccobacillus porphyridii]|uniref:DinB family protein n=1 Tax=Alkalicoccobacillus porphyridii TaxID=2597270 RepID=A0A554A3K5_9BACI|nr:DinB family protein [Alkalicoccobacillus porphyridii]TSB48258.1 DinB family protein [Alkalicoccobacillus porphyridii]
MIDYRIKTKKHYTDKIGELVSMLEHTREVTVSEITDLAQHELDYLANEKSNSIGALLAHITSIEYVHQVISFETRDLTKEEYRKWGTALELGSKARKEIKDRPVDYYIEELHKVRKNTLTYLKSIEDSWLFEEKKWDNGVYHNNYYLWFHVIEDEISHRGQIKTIKRLLLEK